MRRTSIIIQQQEQLWLQIGHQKKKKEPTTKESTKNKTARSTQPTKSTRVLRAISSSSSPRPFFGLYVLCFRLCYSKVSSSSCFHISLMCFYAFSGVVVPVAPPAFLRSPVARLLKKDIPTPPKKRQ